MRTGLALLLGLTLAPAALALDLEGPWHVLLHYRDVGSENPTADRWEDRVWVFTRDGDRLRWTDYPIVVFADPEGRFEQQGGGLPTRVMEFWEPNASQAAELGRGPRVNERGSYSKLLRKTPEGWASSNRRIEVSASVVTFATALSIEDPAGLPVFTRTDSIGSLRTKSREGVTRFTTESVEPDGNTLAGRYERDGRREGTFRLVRTPALRGLGEPLPTERADRSEEAFEASVNRGILFIFREEVDLEGLRAALPKDRVPTREERGALSDGVRDAVKAGFRTRGVDWRDRRSQVENITRQVVAMLVDGRSQEEIVRAFEEGQIIY